MANLIREYACPAAVRRRAARHGLCRAVGGLDAASPRGSGVRAARTPCSASCTSSHWLERRQGLPSRAAGRQPPARRRGYKGKSREIQPGARSSPGPRSLRPAPGAASRTCSGSTGSRARSTTGSPGRGGVARVTAAAALGARPRWSKPRRQGRAAPSRSATARSACSATSTSPTSSARSRSRARTFGRAVGGQRRPRCGAASNSSAAPGAPTRAARSPPRTSRRPTGEARRARAHEGGADDRTRTRTAETSHLPRRAGCLPGCARRSTRCPAGDALPQALRPRRPAPLEVEFESCRARRSPRSSRSSAGAGARCWPAAPCARSSTCLGSAPRSAGSIRAYPGPARRRVPEIAFITGFSPEMVGRRRSTREQASPRGPHLALALRSEFGDPGVPRRLPPQPADRGAQPRHGPGWSARSSAPTSRPARPRVVRSFLVKSACRAGCGAGEPISCAATPRPCTSSIRSSRRAWRSSYWERGDDALRRRPGLIRLPGRVRAATHRSRRLWRSGRARSTLPGTATGSASPT